MLDLFSFVCWMVVYYVCGIDMIIEMMLFVVVCNDVSFK